MTLVETKTDGVGVGVGERVMREDVVGCCVVLGGGGGGGEKDEGVTENIAVVDKVEDGGEGEGAPEIADVVDKVVEGVGEEGVTENIAVLDEVVDDELDICSKGGPTISFHRGSIFVPSPFTLSVELNTSSGT